MTKAQDILYRRPWRFWSTFGFGIAIIIAFFITEMLVSIGFVFVNIGTKPVLDPSQALDAILGIVTAKAGLLAALSTIATAVVGIGLTVAVISMRRGISIPEYLGLKPVSAKTILLSLAIVIGLIIANDATCVIIGRPINPLVMVDTYNTSVWPALFWIAVVIFAPVFEETFFRGFLFKGFSYSRLGIIGTIILTSLAWTLLHQQYEVFELVSIFISGILLGVMRYKTGSLWTPLIMHSFMNVVATLEVALNVNGLFG